MEIAVKNNIDELAFPCISTGVFGYPKEPAASIAVTTVRSLMQMPSTLRRVVFCCFSPGDLQIYERLLGGGLKSGFEGCGSNTGRSHP
jgi:O-acetyl-ADP-ribose deacetylase (regulator of RNase III)